jgi:outer membrane protein TolC
MRHHVAILTALVVAATPADAQHVHVDRAAAMMPQFVDPTNGLTLDMAIGQALAREPGLRAARADVEAARGARDQAGRKPNPTVTFGQQFEPGCPRASGRKPEDSRRGAGIEPVVALICTIQFFHN